MDKKSAHLCKPLMVHDKDMKKISIWMGCPYLDICRIDFAITFYIYDLTNYFGKSLLQKVLLNMFNTLYNSIKKVIVRLPPHYFLKLFFQFFDPLIGIEVPPFTSIALNNSNFKFMKLMKN